MGEADAKLFGDLTAFQNCHLGKRSMDVHTDDFHTLLSMRLGASGLHDIYGSALAAQPGKS
ncbi:hypothetical protein [Sphingobium sp. YR768]|uniref:hypothetical protein n=1 Tax=Sphingobium sp. YR768 TaxID=1884365 RepID=UPI00115F93DB|nr:hypothetical protein [Sphingobium sp. YR768]